MRRGIASPPVEVSWSNLTLRLHGSGKYRKIYAKGDDTVLLPDIRAIMEELPTYGYRRVGSLLNRQVQRRSDRPHDGKVITLKSSLRWSSDGFEIPCWSRVVVRVTLLIDACDEEIIDWGATTGCFDDEMVCDLMLLCVEPRFGSHRTPHAVEWRIDNDSSYTAR